MKKLLVIVLVILGLIFTIGYWFLTHSKPNYTGSLELDGLSAEVTVNFDTYGIPHIYATNEEDAYFALGYLQAQERLFQMEMIRRIASGTLAEVLGEDFIKTDKLFRALSVDQKSDSFIEQFNKADGPYKLPAKAYFSGINSFVENGPTPIEFTVIGIPKTKFSIKDAYNAAGYMSFGFADGFRVDPLTSKIAITLGKDYLDDIGLHTIYDSAYIRSYISEGAMALTGLSPIINSIPLPLLHGSNSWVIGPEKSATGNVIFENDTHIGFNQPSVWYEAHLEYPGASIYGHYLAGFPFAILGHNNYAAWGMTMFENDDIDLFQEKANPENKNQIWRINKWQELEERKEIINVKDSEPIEFIVRSSDHGPIINSVLLADSVIAEPVATYWEYLHATNDLLEPTYALGKVKSMIEARGIAAKIASPGLNIMYGDKAGNIAWWAAARLPIRPDHVNSKLLLDGSSGKDDYLGYHDFQDNPQAENPPWGYVYSANNQPDTINGNFYPGYYRPLDRASRIVGKIEDKNDWTSEEVQAMTKDVTSPIAPLVARELALLLEPEYALLAEPLLSWSGDHQLNQVSPSIYYNLLSWTLYHAMADELGYDDYSTLANLEVMKRSYLMFIKNDSSVWWDNISTPSRETRAQIVNKAAASTLATLKRIYNSAQPSDWQWQKIHTLTHKHPLGEVEALKKYFSIGPLPTIGGNEVINNMMFKLDTTGVFPVFAGPSMRTVIDMGDIAGAKSINPTGQSGHFLSPHYSDQAEKFVNVEFRPQLMEGSSVDAETKSTLLLKPKL